MSVYGGYTVYGPYYRKDGRQHVILVETGLGTKAKRITVSYPKFIVEEYIGRKLEPEETVDHIDGNFSNNSLDNLRIVLRKEHARSHVNVRKYLTKRCVICGKEFSTRDNWRVICGNKSCAGKCTRNRMSPTEARELDAKIESSRGENEYISLRGPDSRN